MPLYDISKNKDIAHLYSQTPPNFTQDNYYLKTIQMKVDADWPFRPNRKTVEEENTFGEDDYSELEVVVQSVKNDKGEVISDDWYRLVFRDCTRNNKIGRKYRFSYNYDTSEPDSAKNIWLGLNHTTLTPTSSQVICRCNGALGSIYTAPDGTTSYHYEPAIQPNKLNSAGFDYSEVAIDPDSNMTLIVQANKYTRQYYINQRFVLGENRVYKITNIYSFDSRITSDPSSIGVYKLYFVIDQVGELDDMQNRIAYNGKAPDPKPTSDSGNYEISIVSPEAIPAIIPTGGITIVPQVTDGGVVVQNVDFSATCTLSGDNSELVPASDYCSVVDNEDGSFKITRNKVAIGWNAIIKFTSVINGEDGPSLEVVFALRPF